MYMQFSFNNATEKQVTIIQSAENKGIFANEMWDSLKYARSDSMCMPLCKNGLICIYLHIVGKYEIEQYPLTGIISKAINKQSHAKAHEFCCGQPILLE